MWEVNGIDVSYWQLKIDWEVALSHGIVFALIRSSIGKEVDHYFERNMKETARLGIPRGIYHYFKPSKNWKEQANLFTSIIRLWPFELDAFVDVEATEGLSKAELANVLEKFVKRVEEQTGTRLGIYTSPGFFNANMPMTSWAKNRRLWVAHWTTAEQPTLPDEWVAINNPRTWTYWQHDSKGNGLGAAYGVPPGGAKDIDLNRFNGTRVEFMNQYNLTSLPEPGQPPEPPDPPPPPPGDIVTVKPGIRLNVRTRPVVADDTKIGSVPGGTEFEVVRRDGEWVAVEAWVHGDWVD